MLLIQCYLKILMFFQSQKYQSFIKYLSNIRGLCSSVRQNCLNLYTLMKTESLMNFVKVSHTAPLVTLDTRTGPTSRSDV